MHILTQEYVLRKTLLDLQELFTSYQQLHILSMSLTLPFLFHTDKKCPTGLQNG